MEEVEREVDLDCDTDRAWRALTEEDELEHWLGGEVDADLEAGGGLTVREQDGTVREGFFESVEPGRELAFWWSTPDEDEPSRVVLRIEPSTDGEGCVVRVTESRPMFSLETELDRIIEAGPGFGPVASGNLACV